MANSGLPSGCEFTQQHQRGPIGSNTHLLTCRPQMPFRYGENVNTAFYRCFRAARLIPNPGGRKRRSASSNTELSSPYFAPQKTWAHELFLLNKTTDYCTPLRSQIDAMQRADLGRHKIIFEDKRGDVRITQQIYCVGVCYRSTISE